VYKKYFIVISWWLTVSCAQQRCPHSSLWNAICLADHCFTIGSDIKWVDSDNEDRYYTAIVAFNCFLEIHLSDTEKYYLIREFGGEGSKVSFDAAYILLNSIHTIRSIHFAPGRRINSCEELSIDEIYLFVNSERMSVERNNKPNYMEIYHQRKLLNN